MHGSIEIDQWNPDARRAYLACAIDTDGWVGLRWTQRKDRTARLTANVGVTNQSIDFLHRLAQIADVPPNIGRNGTKGAIDNRKIVTRSDVWQSYWRSPLHVLKILQLAEPYLIAKRQRALWVIEFCESRITKNGCVDRRWSPYTERSWDLARLVTEANGRAPSVPLVRSGD